MKGRERARTRESSLHKHIGFCQGERGFHWQFLVAIKAHDINNCKIKGKSVIRPKRERVGEREREYGIRNTKILFNKAIAPFEGV